MLSAAWQPYKDPPQCHDIGQMVAPTTEWLRRLRTPWCTDQNSQYVVNVVMSTYPSSLSPPFLRSIFESNDPEGKEFLFNIHQYNMALSFTSLGVREDRLVNCCGGWVFRVQGELCHLIRSLRPGEGDHSSYAQLYIYDVQLALAQRMNWNNNLSPNTMASLQDMLLKHHRYSDKFKHTHETLLDYRNVFDASIRLRVMPGQDYSAHHHILMRHLL